MKDPVQYYCCLGRTLIKDELIKVNLQTQPKPMTSNLTN